MVRLSGLLKPAMDAGNGADPPSDQQLALKDAEIAIKYAAEMGIQLPASRVDVIKFRRVFDADPKSIPPEVESAFWAAASEIAAAIRPVQIEALRERYAFGGDGRKSGMRSAVQLYRRLIWLFLAMTIAVHFVYVLIDGYIDRARAAASDFDAARSVMQTINLPAGGAGSDLGGQAQALKVQRELQCRAARAWGMEIEQITAWVPQGDPWYLRWPPLVGESGPRPEQDHYVRNRYGCDATSYAPIRRGQNQRDYVTGLLAAAAGRLDAAAGPADERDEELVETVRRLLRIVTHIESSAKDLDTAAQSLRGEATQLGAAADERGPTASSVREVIETLEAAAQTLVLTTGEFEANADELEFGKRAGLGSVESWRLMRAAEQWRGLLAKFVLPFLYGLLGATAGIVRLMRGDVTSIRFVPTSGASYALRLPLGALAGATAGLLFDPQTLASVKGVTSLGVAFGLGYGVDIFFAAIDNVIARLERTLAPAPLATPASPATPTPAAPAGG